MDIFDVFMLLGGLVLFLYGMNVMGGGLEKLSGSKLERILENLTNNPLKGVLVGAGVTAIIQSSSATTVMVVGFVNSGIMKLKQAIGIIMGANIGTTVTAWILSLTGIQGDSIWISMLKPTSFAPILAVIGMGVIMFSKSGRKRDLGSILVGFFYAHVRHVGYERRCGSACQQRSVYIHSALVYKSSVWRFGGNGSYGYHTELVGLGRHTAGARYNGEHNVWNGNTYNHGTKHRYMRYGADILYRRQ